MSDFQNRKTVIALERRGNEKQDGSGKWPDLVFQATVVENTAQGKFFVDLAWFDVLEDGRVFPSRGKDGKPFKKLVRADELPGILAAVAECQEFIKGGGKASEPEHTGGDEEIPF